MNVILVSLVVMLFLAHVGSEFTMMADVATEVRAETRARDVGMIAAEIERYLKETGAYPASLTDLSSQPGFEHNRAVDNAAFTYATTTAAITGSVFQFQRAAVVAQDYKRVLSGTDLFAAANNTCGTADFSTDTKWCGRTSDRWRVSESKDFVPDALGHQRALLTKTARKFALFYTAFSTFPNDGGGTFNTLAGLAGYSGGATNCSGTYTWQTIPFTCDDFFSVDGNPVMYRYFTSKSIVLAAATSYVDYAGSAVVITYPLDLP